MTTHADPNAPHAGPSADRAAQAEGPAPGQAPSQEPRSSSEKYLAALWTELIGLDHVTLPQTFLEVGGNSLTLNIILNRIEAETGASIDAQLFYDDDRSSLLELARALDASLAQKPRRAP